MESLDLNLIIEELNKIEDVKGKLKFLEKIIFKTKDKELKMKLVKLLELIQKDSKKRLSFEEIHKEEIPEKRNVSLEGLVARKNVPIENFELKDYVNEVPNEPNFEFEAVRELEEPKLGYIEIEPYKESENKEYFPLELPEYLRSEKTTSFDFGLQDIWESNPAALEPSLGITQKPIAEAVMGEYKREEIISKSIEEARKKEDEYKRKLQKGLI